MATLLRHERDGKLSRALEAILTYNADERASNYIEPSENRQK